MVAIMRFAATIPRAAGPSEYSTLAFCEAISLKNPPDVVRRDARLDPPPTGLLTNKSAGDDSRPDPPSVAVSFRYHPRFEV